MNVYGLMEEAGAAGAAGGMMPAMAGHHGHGIHIVEQHSPSELEIRLPFRGTRVDESLGGPRELVQLPQRFSYGDQPFSTLAAQRHARIVEEQDDVSHLHHDTGFLKQASVGSFIQFLEMDERTCTLEVRQSDSGKTGTLYFRKGRLLDARNDLCKGLDAAVEMLAWRNTDITVTDFCPDISDRVKQRTQNLLMMAAQRMDEQATSAA